MHVAEAIRTRRTVHEYAPSTLPEGAVARAVEAAQWAPNHKLTWPWRFIRVGPQGRAAITEIAVRLKRAKTDLTDAQVAKIRAKTGNPADLIVVAQTLTDDAFRAKEDYAAVACAIQNLALSLWSEGVSSKWGTGGPTRDAETYELLGIDRNAHEIVGFLWIGHPARPPKPPRRPPVDDVYREVP